jgi:hypothetical protein
MSDMSDTLLALRKDPVLFVTTCLNAKPQKWQEEALHAIATKPRVAIRSSHGVGKTAFLSWVILWLLLTRVRATEMGKTPPHRLSEGISFCV